MKEINLKQKISLYKKKGWHKEIVMAYSDYKKTGNEEAKKKIIQHYQGKTIIWENAMLLDLFKKEERLNSIIDLKLKNKTLDKAFADYSTSEKIKKLFEKKQIKIGRMIANHLTKKILMKDKIKLSNFSIISEIIILEKIINGDFVDSHTNKIIQKPLALTKVKQKIKNIKNNQNAFYIFLDEYLSFILKTKKIEIDDFKKRKLIFSLMNMRRIKYKSYGLTKSDLIKLKKY